MRARYRSKCCLCEKIIQVNDRIEQYGDFGNPYCHEDCVTAKRRFPYGVTYFGTPSDSRCSKCYQFGRPMADLQWDVDEVTTVCYVCADAQLFMMSLRKGQKVTFSMYEDITK